MTDFSRRTFIQSASVAFMGFTIPEYLYPMRNTYHFNQIETDYQELSNDLIARWSNSLLKYQISHLKNKGLYGGIISPSYARIEGRCVEAMYPFLYMARKTGDEKYIHAAKNVFSWADHNTSFSDGSWINDVSVSLWKGITVNIAIVLASSIRNYKDLLDTSTYDRWMARLSTAGNWIYKTVDINFGNINYPAVTSAAMTLLGEVLSEPRYTIRGRELAHQVLGHFSPENHLLSGEGNLNERSPKGCLAIDLGYNVEESLPGLSLYCTLSKDNMVEEILIRSLQNHLEFMLPDGAWDNSWGTRNYKWTYWGTRNGDGCQLAYALKADKHTSFLTAALRNMQLLEYCTFDDILYPGMHNHRRGEQVSLHHTFCHAKTLAMTQDFRITDMADFATKDIPQDKERDIIEFRDINTWHISKNNWRATITGYDSEYQKNTHASGGSLSLLYHKIAGPLIAASLVDYRMIEPTNMHMDKKENMESLIPRLELELDKKTYFSSNNLQNTVMWEKTEEKTLFTSEGKLRDFDYEEVPTQETYYFLEHEFGQDDIIIRAGIKANKNANGLISGKSFNLKFMLPIISAGDEQIIRYGTSEVHVRKKNCKISISANQIIEIDGDENSRVFNQVPGFEAIPFFVRFDVSDLIPIEIKIMVTA